MPSSRLHPKTTSSPAEEKPLGRARADAGKRVKLNFGQPKGISTISKSVTLSAEAQTVLGLVPKSLQDEILEVVASGRNNAVALPDAPDTYVAKSKSGFRVLYQTRDNATSVFQIVTPSQLDRFKKVLG